jgi:hypothetical protein
MLGDELYLETNHPELRGVAGRLHAVCAIPRPTTSISSGRTMLSRCDGRITGLVEKPEGRRTATSDAGRTSSRPTSSPDARADARSPRTGRLELTDVI